MWICTVKRFSVNVVANTLASSGMVLDVGLHSEAFLGKRGCEHFGRRRSMWICTVKRFSVNVVANTLASSGTVLDVGLHSEAFLGERGCEHFGKFWDGARCGSAQ